MTSRSRPATYDLCAAPTSVTPDLCRDGSEKRKRRKNRRRGRRAGAGGRRPARAGSRTLTLNLCLPPVAPRRSSHPETRWGKTARFPRRDLEPAWGSTRRSLFFFPHEAALSAEGGFCWTQTLVVAERKKGAGKKHNQLHIYIYELCMLVGRDGGDPAEMKKNNNNNKQKQKQKNNPSMEAASFLRLLCGCETGSRDLPLLPLTPGKQVPAQSGCR